MPFTVDDFEDLIRLLQERPDWRARLRDVLLPRELFELPALAKELTTLNLAEREQRERLQGELTEFRRESNERFDAVDQQLSALRTDIGALKSTVSRFHSDVGMLKGGSMEQRYRELPTLFAAFVPHSVPLSRTEVDVWLHQLVAEGRLAPAELVRVLRADLIFRGGTASQPAYLVVEASWMVDTSDVERAVQRAALLRKAGIDARPAVAGQHIQPEALALAEHDGVGRVIEDELNAAEATEGA